MKRICKAELFKLLHRRETYMILFLMFLAFGLPVGFKMAPSSYALDYSFGDGRLPCLAYMVLGYAFWGTLGIFVLLFTMLSVALSSKEIESHYFYLYFPRAKSRTEIYICKYLILTAFTVIWYVIYTLIFNPLGHMMMCSFRPDMAVNTMTDGSSAYWVCMWIMNLAELLFYISLAAFLGTKRKPLATISVAMVFYYACIFIYDFPLIRYFIPEFYKQSAMGCENMADISGLLFCTAIYVMITLLYDVLLFLGGKNQMKKINA